MMSRGFRTALALALLAGGAGQAQADKIKNPTAVFSGLDKITGRIISFEVAVREPEHDRLRRSRRGHA
jgi:hypothetical protein